MDCVRDKVGHLLVVAVVFLHAVAYAQPECPQATSPCMNEENFEQCREIVNSGCEQLIVMESCPLQFACGDSYSGPEPNACVTLLAYDDETCSGEPKRPLMFPTFSEPGSPCCKWLHLQLAGDVDISSNRCLLFSLDHDATMPKYSVSDQYCNFETGNWHQKLYWLSDNCLKTKKWWQKWWAGSPIELVYTTDACTGGLRLKHCEMGPCEYSNNSDGGTKLSAASEEAAT